jgi:hypothetical protein
MGYLMNYDYKQRAAIENFNWVNNILLSALTLSAVVVAAKLTGLTSVGIYQDIRVSSGNVWKVFVLLTVAHGYAAHLLKQSILELLSSESTQKCKEVYLELTISKGPITRGMTPRRVLSRSFKYLHLYRMNNADLSAWFSCFALMLFMASIIPFSLLNIQSFTKCLIVSALLALINWYIGTSWIILLSMLSDSSQWNEEDALGQISLASYLQISDIRLIFIGLFKQYRIWLYISALFFVILLF